ncbi:MAG: gamma-glutamyltransferase, partial [Sphingomonadaceae bacterium]|nr:gamma-glutamyltransferase [Sphingomonadaceae bacterium]
LVLPLAACAQTAAPPPATAARGVVSAADPRAAEAGREMLRAGGSATDAALAMMLALTVVEPQSSGIGGGGFFLHHSAETGELNTIDGRETAPASATQERFLTDAGAPMGFAEAYQGGLSVGVPGNIRLMATAHRAWGRLEWARLFDPAIRLAEEGYTINDRMAAFLADTRTDWADFPETRAIYWEDGAPKVEGDIVRNPALAALLRRVAADGPDAFYTGANAAAIIETVGEAERNPAAMTTEDLAGYRAIAREPVCRPYRHFRICGMGPPSSGATTVLSILGMLERFELPAMGPDDPRAWHLIGEAMRLAYADRELYLGDADFVEVPVEGLLDRTYLAQRSALISPDRSLGTYGAGTPPGAPERRAGLPVEEGGTTHFAAVDRDGNVANMTSTVESVFGSQLVANGYILNNELTDFAFVPIANGAPVANRVEPGKRPLSSMSPTLVYDSGGRLILALGSAGGKRIIMHVTKTLIGVLDWGLSAEEAIVLPNIYFGRHGLLVESGTSLDAMRPALEALGHVVTPADLASKVNAVEWTDAGWRGAADPRSPGVALSE